MINTDSTHFHAIATCMRLLANRASRELQGNTPRDAVLAALIAAQDNDSDATVESMRVKVAILILLLAEDSVPSVAFNN